MNRQETYEKVRDHLLKQGKQSMTVDKRNRENCLYRGPNGLKCAIGCIIPDDLYRPEMEGKGAESEALADVRLALGATSLDDVTFLTDLQELHDECEPQAWPDRLTRFALEHGLTP